MPTLEIIIHRKFWCSAMFLSWTEINIEKIYEQGVLKSTIGIEIFYLLFRSSVMLWELVMENVVQVSPSAGLVGFATWSIACYTPFHSFPKVLTDYMEKRPESTSQGKFQSGKIWLRWVFFSLQITLKKNLSVRSNNNNIWNSASLVIIIIQNSASFLIVAPRIMVWQVLLLPVL